MKMKKTLILVLLLSFCALPASPLFAQQKDNNKTEELPAAYKVNFVLAEIEGGRRVNERNYSSIVRERRQFTVRTGDRIPVVTRSGGQQARDEWQYLDVGFRLESTLETSGPDVIVQGTYDLSTIVNPESKSASGTPVIRQVRQEFSSIVPVGKSTVISSSDDVNSKRTYQLEVTVTKLR
jgi:hypothetical protein